MEVFNLSPGELIPYAKNAKNHPPKQVDAIAESIRQFGFQQPIVVDRDKVVIIGHGRLAAAKQLMLDKVPVVFADQLTEEQANALRLADNKTNESEWNLDFLNEELAALEIAGIDVSAIGFDMESLDGTDWFNRTEKDGDKRQEGNDEYNEFLDKFEQPKTTDDCYTPDNVYAAVAEWVAREWNLDREKFVRPFYPGGDYQNFKYPKGSTVVDNPPFSILSEIIKFYCEKGIPFFLFAPTLTLFTAVGSDVEYMPIGVPVLYENGATVNTSFINNIGDSRIYVSASLYEAVDKANDENIEAAKKNLPKFEYPVEAVLAARIYTLAKYGQVLKIPKSACVYRNRLDAQKETGKDAFGGLFLISERAAAERAAAERAENGTLDKKWELSEEERKIVRELDKETEKRTRTNGKKKAEEHEPAGTGG